jgi:hypothetical protein
LASPINSTQLSERSRAILPSARPNYRKRTQPSLEKIRLGMLGTRRPSRRSSTFSADSAAARRRSGARTSDTTRLGASRPNPGAAVPLPLEDALRHRRCYGVEILLPALRRHDPQGRGRRLPAAFAPSCAQEAADHLGSPQPASEPPREGLRGKPARSDRARVPARLCPVSVEHIWGYWKKHELPNLCAKDLVELGSSGRPALRPMRRRPKLIECFWKQAELSL